MLPGDCAYYLPFWRDADRNYYVLGMPKTQPKAPGLAHKVVYRIAAGGKATQVLDTAGLLPSRRGEHEEVGRCLYVTPDGAVYFDTMMRTPGYGSGGGPYRIYKAVPKRRWQVWLEKLGVR